MSEECDMLDEITKQMYMITITELTKETFEEKRENIRKSVPGLDDETFEKYFDILKEAYIAGTANGADLMHIYMRKEGKNVCNN